jgi:SAM-dependent methyltransferase
MKYWSLASVGKALDIACGNGRNSLFLAEKGFRVDAVDISTIATDRLKAHNAKIDVICTDLDTWDCPPNHYELIINIRFLDRRLFHPIQAGLKSGGLLIFESFSDREAGTYCLKHNELPQALPSLTVVHYAERQIEHPGKFNRIASLVAIK